jgi:soluble lytic murein transglycosylase
LHKRRYNIGLYLALIIILILIAILFENAAKAMFPVKYSQYVKEYSQENDLDPYLVLAVIKAESSFNPNAISSKSARGLMQISEATGVWAAKILGIPDYRTELLYDPDTNIKLGCWYLGRLIKDFNGDTDLAIAAYNGGSRNVRDWLKNSLYSENGNKLTKIPFKETEVFLKKVRNFRYIYKKLYEKGF